ncbi:MAG: hypothetical protein WAO48_09930, partial [Vulcanococcus sp.]
PLLGLFFYPLLGLLGFAAQPPNDRTEGGGLLATRHCDGRWRRLPIEHLQLPQETGASRCAELAPAVESEGQSPEAGP